MIEFFSSDFCCNPGFGGGRDGDGKTMGEMLDDKRAGGSGLAGPGDGGEEGGHFGGNWGEKEGCRIERYQLVAE